MTTKEITSTLRGQFKKEFGLTSKDVSIRKTSHSAVHISIESVEAFLHLEEIKAAAASHENISYCESSGEILSGGNTFVFVAVAYTVKVAVAAPYMNDAAKLYATVSALQINQGESLENKDFHLMNDGGRCVGFSGGRSCGNFYADETLALAFAIANASDRGGMRKSDNSSSL